MKWQDQLKELLEYGGKSYTWLGEKMGMTRQNINYHLNQSKKYNKEFFDKALEVISENVDLDIESLKEEHAPVSTIHHQIKGYRDHIKMLQEQLENYKTMLKHKEEVIELQKQLLKGK